MLSITFFNSKEHVQFTCAAAPILIGSDTIKLRESDCQSRVRIADPDVEPIHCRVEEHSDGVATIQNFGETIVLETGPRIFRNIKTQIQLPCLIRIGETHVQIQSSNAKHLLDESIVSVNDERALGSAHARQKHAPDEATVSAWFEAIGKLNQSAAGSEEFFHLAAKALFRPGGLDGGIILQPDNGSWKVISSYVPYPEYSISFREDLATRCLQERATLYHDSGKIESETISDDVQSVIVCPIFDENKSVVAVTYGFRNQHRTNNRRGIRTLEMKFCQLIANSISIALARIEREAKAAQDRVLLEQAFSPKVAQQLGAGQPILGGRTQEVSVLFADLRGFTTISQKIGTELTYELLTEVMDAFSQVIAEEDGVIIDFYGDGLSAFWNAPFLQPNHQQLACRAALNIANALEPINRDWAGRLGQRLRVGIGLHCGIAQVGNSGSSSRLKYGPQGAPVNLTSRLENAAKDIGVSIIMSGEMAQAIKDVGGVSTRRICNASLCGTRCITELHQLIDPLDGTVPDTGFEAALDQFEKSQFGLSVVALTELQVKNEIDFATEFLLRQALGRTKSEFQVHELESGKETIVALTNEDANQLSEELKSDQRQCRIDAVGETKSSTESANANS